MKGAAQPAKLRVLLRRARGRIPPERYDLETPTDPRGQRADGLTQGHMDRLLRVSDNTYARLERGAIHRPSRELLEAVGRVLELSQTEWRELWAYAMGQEPPDALHPHAEVDVPAVWHRICHQLPLPTMAYLIGGDWSLIDHNAAFASLFPRRQPPDNVLRWMLLDPDARDNVLLDWRRYWAPAVMSQLRIAHAARPWQHTLTRLVAEVEADPVAGPLYHRDPRAELHPDGDVRPLRHPDRGDGYAHIGAAALIGAAGARFMVVHFTPAADRSNFRPSDGGHACFNSRPIPIS